MKFRGFPSHVSCKRFFILAVVACNMSIVIPPVSAVGSGTPTNVMAVALPGKQATVSWNEPANAEQLGIVSYSVELPGYLADYNNPAICTVQATVNSAEHSCTVQDLPTENQPYLSYFFYVIPTDAGGRNTDLAQQSNTVTIYDTPQAPSAPEEVTTVPGNQSVRVTWQTPAFDGGSPIESYTATTADGLFGCTAISESCTITGLTNGQNYFINVVASNDIGESQAGYSQRWVTPFAGNFDVLVPNSFNNYVDGHQQVRNLPSGKSLYSIGCESTADTLNLTLRTINTQNSNYSNSKTISFSDNPSIQNLSCIYVFTASGPSGVFMVIGNEEGDANQLYGLNLSSGAATLIGDFDGIVLGLTQDHSGVLRIFSLPMGGQYAFPMLITRVIDSLTATLDTPLLIAQDKVVPVNEFELLELGDLDFDALSLPYSDGAVRAVLYMGDIGPMTSIFNIVEFDAEGNIIEDMGADFTPLGEILDMDEFDLDAFVFGFNSPAILPNDYLTLLRSIRSGNSYPSFNAYQNRAYLLTGRSASDRAASLFELDLTSGHVESVGDFPAFSIPFGVDSGYGIDVPFAITTIDSNGVLWNQTNGLLQSESITGFQDVGDYQVARTAQSDFSVPSSSVSIFVAPSPITPVVTPPVVTPPVMTYVQPSLVPYLKTLVFPKMNLKDEKVTCSAGTYNAGYTLSGVNQGSSISLFTPPAFTFRIFFDGVSQDSLTVISENATASWKMPSAPIGALISCSVTVSVNGVTNSDKSTENNAGVVAAMDAQVAAKDRAQIDYPESLTASSKAYEKALSDNRFTWQSNIEKQRRDYQARLAKIKSLPATKATRASATRALSNFSASRAKILANYTARNQAAFAAKELADRQALLSRDAAIAKASATYSAFIESIGHGVLIP